MRACQQKVFNPYSANYDKSRFEAIGLADQITVIRNQMSSRAAFLR